MRFAIGYQLADDGDESTVDLVRDYRRHVAEVYFPWVDLPSGRAALATRRGQTDWTAQARLECDLRALRELGTELDLLFNANCYGAWGVSVRLENQVGSLLAHLEDAVGGVQTVTTTSPAVAHAVKRHFPKVRTRASVNMRLGEVQALEQVADLFDDYCVRREHNRDLEHLRRLKTWADANGKRLCLLANSGCLYACSFQTFHDNLVAHDAEVDEVERMEGFEPFACRRACQQRERWPALLQATWVRPEDLRHYDGLFDTVKLATRMHQHPRLVLDAYVRRSHRGNLLDLLEPGLGPFLAPGILDNTRFPDDWFRKTSTCGRHCENCEYCAQVLSHVLAHAD
mgnify:CR=1 FL=1